MFKPIKSLSDMKPTQYLTWFTLAFQAGIINSGGFLACHRFVTHTTGFATHFAVEANQGALSSAFSMLTVPIFFLAGSILAGYFIDRPVSFEKRPRYEIILLIMTFIMALISLLGIFGEFGQFGEPYVLGRDFFLLTLLCFTSGLQNALTTRATDAVIRTTHLTGITTDLGIGIARVIWGNKKNAQDLKKVSLANQIRMILIASFAGGSLIGAFVFIHFEYGGFLIPAFISGILGSIGFYKYSKHLNFQI